MNVELWDILDGNGKPTGKTVRRGDPMQAGEFHLVVHVWIKDSRGRYLISKRSPNKELLPNYWDTTCGAAISGEDSLAAALREAKEEVGVDLNPRRGNMILRYKRHHKDRSLFVDVWLFHKDAPDDKIVIQLEEVSEAKWADEAEIRELVARKEFVPTAPYLDLLFDPE